MLEFMGNAPGAIWSFVRLYQSSSSRDESFSQNAVQEIVNLQQRIAELEYCQQQDIDDMSDYCQGFVGGEEGGIEWANIALMMGLSVASLTAYYTLPYVKGYMGNSDLRLPCSLEGKVAGKETAYAEFKKHFENIMSKYKGVEGALSGSEKKLLENTIKALFKHYFWKDEYTPTEKTMRKELCRKLELFCHTDKIVKESVSDFETLTGSSVVSFMHQVKDMQVNADDHNLRDNAIDITEAEKEREISAKKDRQFLKDIPCLATALTIHEASYKHSDSTTTRAANWVYGLRG